jgi:7-carboxy-7-deazaguanine synthase
MKPILETGEEKRSPLPRLAVSEIFGPTIQGEGPSVGLPAVFLRLSGCNLSCVWCDTPYTWNWKLFDPKIEVHMMEIEEVLRELLHLLNLIEGNRVLVITGGEPLLQRMNLLSLMSALHRETNWENLRIEIETAGTIYPFFRDQPIYYNVSPKLEHSGNPKANRIRPEALEAFGELSAAGTACFKFVVQSPSDLSEVDELVHSYQLENIYIMAEGITSEGLRDTQRDIMNDCIRRGYRISPRLHIDLFGNRRGV